MDRTVVPLKVQEYVLAQTGERHLNMQLDLFKIDVTDPAFKDKDVVIFSLKRRFPMVAEFRHRHMGVLMKGDDPEHPLSQYTLAHFDCGPLGTFYFLFQGIEPSFLFDERDSEMRPVFSKENVLKSLAPGATIATCKITRVNPKICCNCGARSAALHCLPCKEKKRNKFYYCSESCQTEHWPYHKAICMKNKD